MKIISIAATMLAIQAIVPDDAGIVGAKSVSSSTHHGETRDAAAASKLALPSSLTSLSLAQLKKQQQLLLLQRQHAAIVAGSMPQQHHHHTRSLQLQDETTGERLDSSSPSSPSQICSTCPFPQKYTFRLAFNDNCSTSTLQATSSHLLSGTECVMTTSDMPPTYISSIHFLEFDNTAYLNVIHENTTYLNNVTFYNNDTFTFPSSIAATTTNTTNDTTTTTLTDGGKDGQGTITLPGAAGLFLFENDENGQPILRSQVVWTFGTPEVGDCANATEELEGKSLGWVIFEEVVSTEQEFCLDLSSSPSSPSSSSSMPQSTIFVSASPASEPIDNSSLPPTLAPPTTALKTEAPTLTTNILSPLPTTSTDTLPTIIIDSSSSPSTTIGIGLDGSKTSKRGQQSKTSKVSSKKKEDRSDDDGSSSLSKTAKSGTII